MKQALSAAMILMILLFTAPVLLLRDDTPPEDPKQLHYKTEKKETTDKPEQEKKETSGVRDEEKTLCVYNGKKTVKMTMAEYLVGVVRGEMPATFESAALEAQAVAERTYICYQMSKGRKQRHPKADVCMSPACCNAFLSEEDAKEKWGSKFKEYNKKIKQAVKDTDGQIVLYDGEPILAAFHSSSAGKTANCDDVWVDSLPYLTSVKSPESSDTVPNFYSVNAFSAEEFCQLISSAYPDADLSGSARSWITDRKENDSGRVEQITIGGVRLTGAQVRSIFSLRSACFTVETGDDAVTFHVTGYGHGVGMSQYGANELASEGKTWQEIMRWYYTDVDIGTMS